MFVESKKWKWLATYFIAIGVFALASVPAASAATSAGDLCQTTSLSTGCLTIWGGEAGGRCWAEIENSDCVNCVRDTGWVCTWHESPDDLIDYKRGFPQ